MIVSHSQKLPVPLEPDPAQMRALGDDVLDFVIGFIEQLATAPAEELDHPLPETVDDVLDYIGHAARKAVDEAGHASGVRSADFVVQQ